MRGLSLGLLVLLALTVSTAGLMCGAAGARGESLTALGSAPLGGAPAGAPVAPHCLGVSPELKQHVIDRMVQAKGLHEHWAQRVQREPETIPIAGDKAWHDEWVETYAKTLWMLVMLLRGCE